MVAAAALMIAVDVIARKLFSVSIGASSEVSGYVLAIGTSWALALALREAAQDTPALLFVNDRLDLARMSGAAGLHLPGAGLPPAAARALLAPGVFLGQSAHTAQDARTAHAAGADFVGPEYVQKIKDGWLDCDVIVATPDMMGQVGPLGRVLGPRGLMPNPKSGTVTMDVTKAVRDVKAGKIEFRVDKTGNLHAPIGRVSFAAEQLAENLGAFMDAVVRAKPAGAKGSYLRSVTVSSTMGPGVPVDVAGYR